VYAAAQPPWYSEMTNDLTVSCWPKTGRQNRRMLTIDVIGFLIGFTFYITT
jgi:hypothetical protein